MKKINGFLELTPAYRKFDGKTFKSNSVVTTKKRADDFADIYRKGKHGCPKQKARVVKVPGGYRVFNEGKKRRK